LLFLNIRRRIGRPTKAEMKTKYIVRFVFGLFLLTLGNGCATKALWKNDNLEAWNEPTSNANIRIFASKAHGDMLVIYDEYSERSGATHTRAYWLNENEKLIGQGHMPHFISANSVFPLTPVPVVPVTTNHVDFPSRPYAQLEFDQHSFTLFLDHDETRSYNLPVYNDGKGKVEKFALTPLATAADITIVGGFLGYFWLAGVASGYNPSY
jgi:hypothetical protein